jgi:quinol monooxygenase YgiN
MFIAIVDVQVAAKDRATALSVLRTDGSEARALPGNQSYHAFTDPESETNVRIFHEWDNQAAFDAYLRSEAFERIGRQLRPMLTSAPTSRRFSAELVETRNN